MKKIVIPLLLPPLIGGCNGFATRNTPPDTPALVFVDGQISDSADTITQTQRRLVPPPSTPVPVRSVQPATSLSRSAPLPTPMLQPMAMASTKTASSPGFTPNATGMLAKPSPVPSKGETAPALPGLTYVGTPGTIAVLSLSSARNLTLEQWIRRIIPSGWQLEYEYALHQKLNTRIVSVNTNDQWTRVLSRLLTEQSIDGQVDWNRQTVSLRRVGQPATVVAPSVIQNNATVPTAISATAPKNPFSSTPSGKLPAPITAPSAVTTGKGSLKTATPVPLKPGPNLGQPVMPVETGKAWLAPAGTTLRETVIKWAGETRCESGVSQNWTVIWPTSVTDYRLDAPIPLHGNFESVLWQLFDLYRTAKKPLYAVATRVQCLVTVSDTPQQN